MNTKYLLTCLLAFSYSGIVLSCSCFGPKNLAFCENVKSFHKIVTGVVTNADLEQVRGFSILDVIQGDVPEAEISVLGENGFNCGESIASFAIGDTIIMALMNWSLDPGVNYHLHGCDLLYLRIQNNQVVGTIHGEPTSESYSFFLENFENCLLETNVNEIPIDEIISFNPTLIDNTIQIQNLSNTPLEISFYSTQGQFFESVHLEPFSNDFLDVDHFAAGLFFAAIRRENKLNVKKLVKL